MRGIALVPLEVNEPSTTNPRLRVVFNNATTSIGMLRILHQSREELSGVSGRLKFCNIVQAVSGGWHRDQMPGPSGEWHRRMRQWVTTVANAKFFAHVCGMSAQLGHTIGAIQSCNPMKWTGSGVSEVSGMSCADTLGCWCVCSGGWHDSASARSAAWPFLSPLRWVAPAEDASIAGGTFGC